MYTSFMAYHSGVYHKRFIDLMEGVHPHPTPYTLHPAPNTQHPTPYTLHPTPYTLHPKPSTLQGHAIKIVGWGVEPAKNRCTSSSPSLLSSLELSHTEVGEP